MFVRIITQQINIANQFFKTITKINQIIKIIYFDIYIMFLINNISRLTQGRHRAHTEKSPIKDKLTRMQNAVSTLKREMAETIAGSKKIASDADLLMEELKTIEARLDAKLVSERINLWTRGREAANSEKQKGHNAEQRIIISAKKERIAQRVSRARDANTRKILGKTAISYVPINITQEATKIKAKVSSALSEAANIVGNIKKNEERIDIRQEIVLLRLNPLQQNLIEKGLVVVDEYIYHDLRGKKLKHRRHFLDQIKLNFKEMVEILESMKIMIERLTVILEEMNRLVPPSIEPEADIPQKSQKEILRNAFNKLYEDYKIKTTTPKDIPEYFECPLELETIMFPLSYTNKAGFVYTYDRDYITRHVSRTKTHPETRETVEITEFVPDDIFNELLDEFIIDPDAYYEKYDTDHYQEAHRAKSKSKLNKAMKRKSKERTSKERKSKERKLKKITKRHH